MDRLRLAYKAFKSFASHRVGEKVQYSHIFFTRKSIKFWGSRVLAAVLGLTLVAEAHAAGFIAAVESYKRRVRQEEAFSDQFELFVAPVPSVNSVPSARGRQDLPEPQMIELPATVGAYQMVDAWLMFGKRNECFVPDRALLNISTLTNVQASGYLMWPAGYNGEAKRCRDRVLPVNGVCADGRAPTVNVCANGKLMVLDFSEALDVDGRAYSSDLLVEKIKSAIKSN